MKQVVVEKFGGVEVLEVRENAMPKLRTGEVRVALTSIGMNHAELMARNGDYKLSSGEPPFTPGLEGGGIVDAVGPDAEPKLLGKRVILSADAPRPSAGGVGGTYRSHYIVKPDKLLPAPDNLPDDQLGTLWLPYLTAWGCLAWKQKLRPGQFVALPAASSSVGIAAAQIVKHLGGISIGMTTSEEKAQLLKKMPESDFDHVVVTHNQDRTMRRWDKELQTITDGNGVDVFFDPVASGAYLNKEIRTLAMRGTIWVYGLLGSPDTVHVSPLIYKHGAIRGWVLSELYGQNPSQREDSGGSPSRPTRSAAAQEGYDEILSGVAEGRYRMHIGGRFKLDDVQHAHAEMEKGRHVGKLVLVP